MKRPTTEEMLSNEDFILWGARVFNDNYYSSLCTSEEADSGHHYDLLINDIKSGYADDVWLAYQNEKAITGKDELC